MAEEGGFPQQKLLEKCPQNQISTLLHGLIDGICGKCPPRYQDYAKIWSLEEWWNVCDYFKELAKDTLKNIWSKDEIAAHLEGLGSSKQEVLDVFWVRREDMQQHLRQETCAISRTQL
ncbi:COMM domain-containing protein 8-like, partial [Lingula anatina]